MSWQALLAISIVANVGWALFQRYLISKEKTDPIALAIIFQLLTGFLIFLYTLLVGFRLPTLSIVWLNLLAMPVIYLVSNVLNFRALKLIEASEFAIISATRVFWIILIAVLILGERFSLQQFGGAIIIFISVIFLFWRRGRFQINRGVILALFGAIFIGIGVANDSYIVRYGDVPSYVVLAFALPGALTFIVFPSSGKGVLHIAHTHRIALLCFGFVASVNAITYYLAYQAANNAAQLASINQITTVLVVVAAAIFLNERTNMIKKLLAAMLSFIGVVLIIS